MKIYTEIIGNINDKDWNSKLQNSKKEYLNLDQWTAQKSRFVLKSDQGKEYAVSLTRHTQILDGDILDFDAENSRALILRIILNEVMVVNLSGLMKQSPEEMLHIAIELGHAIGNQHWPAVIKGSELFIPLTVDKKVMESVMNTHHIEGITYSFRPGSEVIPYLAPHEIRRLFGATGPDSHVHHHHHHIDCIDDSIDGEYSHIPD